jgi:tRNA-splicing ligase RtcB
MTNHIRTEKKQIKLNKSKVTQIETKTGKIQVWSEKDTIDEDETRVMIKLTKLKHIFKHIAVLPDFHISGLLMNGSVMATKDYVYVNAIGGDIGCGMASIKLPLNNNTIKGREQELYKLFYAAVPTGRRTHNDIAEHIENHVIFNNPSHLLTNKVIKKLKQQMGTVGDGNHFLEVQQNEAGELHLLIHTGSRYFGQLIKEYYVKNIVDMQNNKLYAIKADSEMGKKFMADHDLALEYARENRKEIMRLALQVLKDYLHLNEGFVNEQLAQVVDLPHNFIAEEEHFGMQVYVHRKGAQRMQKDDPGIIPGDMGNATYLVQGRGYKPTFNSCSHGAGRKISRGKALNMVDYEQFLESVEGIACRNDRNILDEAPQAYKDIEQVMKYQKEIVKIVDVLTPVINVKG